MHQVTRSIFIVLLAMLLLSGCQWLEPQEPSSEPVEEPSVELPTPTEITAQSDIPIAQATLASPEQPAGEVLLLQPTEDPKASSAFLPTPTPTPGPGGLIVKALSVNVRSGPGTAYEVIDVVDIDEEFDIVGRNEAGDWWQACCFDGEMGWFFDPLVEVTDPESVPVATDIPPVPLPTPTAEGEPVETVETDNVDETEEPTAEQTPTVSPDETQESTAEQTPTVSPDVTQEPTADQTPTGSDGEAEEVANP